MRLSPVHVPDRELSSEQVWDNLIYFLERVVPVAEALDTMRDPWRRLLRVLPVQSALLLTRSS